MLAVKRVVAGAIIPEAFLTSPVFGNNLKGTAFMKIKIFTRPTLAEALRAIRRELGPEAIIISSYEDPATQTAKVTAAIDPAEKPIQRPQKRQPSLLTTPSWKREAVPLPRHGFSQHLSDDEPRMSQRPASTVTPLVPGKISPWQNALRQKALLNKASPPVRQQQVQQQVQQQAQHQRHQPSPLSKRRPDRGPLVSPAQLIPLFEKHFVSEDAARWAFDRLACAEQNGQLHATDLQDFLGYLLGPSEDLFAPERLRHRHVFLIVGPPGAGKTVTTAKLVAQALLNDLEPQLLSLDVFKAGAREQMQIYGKSLGCPTTIIDDLSVLPRHVARSNQRQPLFVDTPGVNLNDRADQILLGKIVLYLKCRPILVFPLGMNPRIVAAQLRQFQQFGGQTLILTRFDMIEDLETVLKIKSMGLNIAGITQGPHLGSLLMRPDGQEFLDKLTQFDDEEAVKSLLSRHMTQDLTTQDLITQDLTDTREAVAQ